MLYRCVIRRSYTSKFTVLENLLITPACQIDLDALEKMPLDQLEQIVQDLQRDLKNASHFVNEQEERAEIANRQLMNCKRS